MKTKSILLFLIFFACGKHDNSKKFQINAEDVIDLSNDIVDFETIQIISLPHVTILDEYILITDLNATIGKAIHIYDKNSLHYITSTAEIGEGPGEIMRIGEIALSYNNKEFWIPDFGKLRAFKFNLDSILILRDYKPNVSIPIHSDFFLTRYNVISDSIALGSGVEVLSPGTFRISLGKWNLKTGKVEKFGYEHPDLAKKRTNGFFNYSLSKKLMALAYSNHNILSVFDENGNIKFNLLGEIDKAKESKNPKYFSQVSILDNLIITSYLGGSGFKLNSDKRPVGVHPNQLLFFNLSGELEKVVDTGHQMMTFTIDEENQRIFCYFPEREIPIGYFYF